METRNERNTMQQREIKRYTLADSPEWVRNHSDWTPWETGKALGEIRRWNDKHAPQLRDENPLPVLADDAPLVSRLWNCLVRHWELTGKDRPHAEIVAQLDAGKGPDGGDIGGKPLFDLVLSVALCERQKKAAEHYGTNILPRILSTARFAYSLFDQRYDDDWQGDFYGYLVETGREKDKPLDRYLGLSGLLPWLRKKLVGFLRDRFRKEDRYHGKVGDEASLNGDPDAASPLEGFCDKNGTPLDDAALAELADLLRDALQKALVALTPEEQLRLGFFYGERKQNQWVARHFNEHYSKTSRKLTQAKERFQKLLSDELEQKKSSDPAISDSLPLLMERAAHIFVDLLQSE